MKSINKIILILIASFIVSVFFKWALLAVTDKLFLEKGFITKLESKETQEKINQELARRYNEDSTNQDYNINFDKLGIGIDWPWYSHVFFQVIYLAYWFMFGRLFKDKFLKDKWQLCLYVPIIRGVLALNIIYIFYVLSCYAGGRLQFGGNDSKKTYNQAVL